MIVVTVPSACSGCTACMSVCAHHAIEMKPDALGFKFPVVDTGRCVGCGLCDSVCPFNENYDSSLNLSAPVAFAARHRNLEEVATSRSGAVFIALSEKILQDGGAVYGAALSANFTVEHKRAVARRELDRFKGSKYVQSDLGTVFSQVKSDLRAGMKVLFSGTPCQTAGLAAFVGGRYRDSLYLVDIICHGVASPAVWNDYLEYLKKKENDRILSVNFRDKNIFGWSGLHKESFVFERKGTKTYAYTFYNPYMLRRSCNNCHFANLRRPSDITLGDLWGWTNVAPEFNKDDKGVSLVICNTAKGLNLYGSVSDALYSKRIDLRKCMQHNLAAPTPEDPRREAFERDYEMYGFRYVMKKYGDIGLARQVKRGIRFVGRMCNKIKKMV